MCKLFEMSARFCRRITNKYITKKVGQMLTADALLIRGGDLAIAMISIKNKYKWQVALPPKIGIVQKIGNVWGYRYGHKSLAC